MPAIVGGAFALCACGTRIDTSGLLEGPVFVASVPKVTSETILNHQRAHWLELHTKTDPTPEWFEDWLKRVPNIGCDCRKGVLEYIVDNPFDFSSPAAFFACSVGLHNFVNEKLGKPIMPLADARLLYGAGAK